uniref:Uncharacterized protein n=1 Tax=Anguilla anguilla TaxID=7936 RepID=A0A0E9RMK3_ANGAN
MYSGGGCLLVCAVLKCQGCVCMQMNTNLEFQIRRN